MVRDGVIYTCDRCGKKKIYDNDQLAKMDGWNKYQGKDLCLNCSYEFEYLIDDFFNKVTEAQDG